MAQCIRQRSGMKAMVEYMQIISEFDELAECGAAEFLDPTWCEEGEVEEEEEEDAEDDEDDEVPLSERMVWIEEQQKRKDVARKGVVTKRLRQESRLPSLCCESRGGLVLHTAVRRSASQTRCAPPQPPQPSPLPPPPVYAHPPPPFPSLAPTNNPTCIPLFAVLGTKANIACPHLA